MKMPTKKTSWRGDVAVWAAATCLVFLTAGASRAGTVTILDDDFESGLGNWTVDDFGGNGAWGINTDPTHPEPGSSDNVYCCQTHVPAPGNYNDDMHAWLTFGPFDLLGATSASVTFDIWVHTEVTVDYVFWGASLDDVDYTGTSMSGDHSGDGWQQQVFDLAAYCGEPVVYFAFCFVSDVSIKREGVYVDNVLIQQESWPNLQIVSITPELSDPLITDTIYVDVVVENTGGVTITDDFDIELFYNPGGAPSVGDTGNGTETVLVGSGLDPGEQATVRFSGITNGTVITWQMYAIVDNGEVVAEGNEGDNVSGPQPLNWTAPDLDIISITPSPGSPVVGIPLTITVTVQNIGNAAVTDDFIVTLFQNEAVEPNVGDSGTDYAVLVGAGLLPGNQVQAVFSGITNFTPGTWQVYAIADNGEAVTESDETNNVEGPEDVVWRAPELTITAITPEDSSPAVGAPIYVDVTVENQGNADIASFRLDLFLNLGSAPGVGTTSGYNQTYASGLAQGNSVQVRFNGIMNSTPEQWAMYAIVDTFNIVYEGDETDNVFGPITVTWRGPDLVITAITPENSTPSLGDTIYVDVTVENQGTVASPVFRVDLFHDLAAAPTVGDTGDANLNSASGLAASDSTTIRFNGVSHSVLEDWDMYAVVDTLNAIPEEDDQTNNVFGPAAVSWQACDLVITAISPEDGTPTAEGTIYIEVTIENQGTVDSPPFRLDLFYNTVPSVGDTGDEFHDFATGLAQGNSTTFRFENVTNAVPEDWNIYAVVDTLDAIPEEDDQTNNVYGPAAVSWQAPALLYVGAGCNAGPGSGHAGIAIVFAWFLPLFLVLMLRKRRARK